MVTIDTKTSISQIKFSIREVLQDNGSNPVGQGFIKEYWLVMHVSFTYDSLLGDHTVSSTAEDRYLKISEVGYDESGNCGTPTSVSSIPSPSEIVEYAESLVEEKVKSLINEEILRTNVEKYLRDIEKSDVPDIVKRLTGLDELMKG